MIQRSFASGEIAPALFGRVDQAKYATGLKKCRNFMVMRHGGVTNRPGTEFIAEVKDSSKRVRLVEFVFNAEQTYILEFGEEYIRFYRNQARITVSGVTAWSAATNYVVGDLASRLGVNYYCILAHTNQQPPNATYWYPLTGDIYEIPTPYQEDELMELQYVQSADVMTIVHPDHSVRDLSRTAHTTWTLVPVVFAPTQAAPTLPVITGTAGALTHTYHITSLDIDTGEESLALVGTQGALTAPSSAQPHTISWTAAAGADEYTVYYVKDGVAGFIGTAIGTSFVNNGIEPDFLNTPPVARNPFSGAGNFPSAVTYHQQRLMLANTANNPEGVWGSRSGLRKNFTVSSPLQDDDAITFKVSGRQVNQVKHLGELGALLPFTSGGEWSVTGDDAGILKPTAINPKQHTSNGSGLIRPLNVGGNLLYVQARGAIVRDLAFELTADSYRGNDLTIFSAHLFDGHTIEDWAYQQIPHSILWAVRDDGTLLGLTYVREHQLWAWHRHDFTNGTVENVNVIPEGTEDFVYLVVNRTINGSTVRYIERMSTRRIDDIIDAVFMDSALTYDGRNTGATTMMLSGGTTWEYTETLTLTASASTFTAADVGNAIHMTDADGITVRCTITAYTSATEVSVQPSMTVPASMQGFAITNWGRAVDVISGLDHLIGEDVAIFADGYVVGSPNDPSYTTYTVDSSGEVQLERPYVTIHAGLPITADIETLNIDTVQSETLADKNKNVSRVSMFVEGSRGIFVGSKPPEENMSNEDDSPLYDLDELKIRENEDYNQPVSLATDVVSVNISSEWNSNGRIFIRQVHPLPLSVLAVVPAGMVPFR